MKQQVRPDESVTERIANALERIADAMDGLNEALVEKKGGPSIAAHIAFASGAIAAALIVPEREKEDTSAAELMESGCNAAEYTFKD